MATIIVLGAGLGGVACAHAMKWAHVVRTGSITPIYEKYVLSTLGIEALK